MKPPLRPLRFAVVTALGLSALCNPCLADRDIVISARYYYRPDSARTSHFHLYRINPDGGGRTQLTFGRADDMQPLWSPDGKRIAFVRRYPSTVNRDETYGVLCVTGARGGKVAELKRYTDNLYFDFTWSRDGGALIDGPDVIQVGGRPKLQPWEQDPFNRPSPDGKYGYQSSNGDEVDTIVEIRTNRSITASAHLETAAWLDSSTIAGIVEKD